MFNTLNDLTANEKELILKADLVKKASERLGNQIHRTPVFIAPLALKEPVFWKHSILKWISWPKNLFS